MTPLLTISLIGIILAATILALVRRDHLHGVDGASWLVLAAIVLGVAIFPGSIDRLGRWMGIAYPPMLVVALGMGVLVIRMLATDIAATRRERALRRLVQRVALLESTVEALGGQPIALDGERDSGPNAPR